MSPPVSSGSSASPAKCGRSARAAGRRSARPKRSLPSRAEQRGPKPIVSVSRDGGRPSASPVSSGGGLAGAVDRADAAGVAAGGHPGRRGRPLLQQLDELRAVVGDDVEGGEVQAVLGRGDDAGLVRAVEGDRRTGVRWPVPGARRRRSARAPATPAAAAPMAPAPARPSVSRRSHRSSLPSERSRPRGRDRGALLAGHQRGDLADRLGQRVDRVGELP